MTKPDLSSVKAVLFDMDGTLVDSDDQAVDRLARRLRPLLRHRAHGSARWLWMKAETPGNAFITFLDRLHLDGPAMAAAGRLRGSKAGHGAEVFPLVSGVAEMLAALHGRFTIGLVTTRGRKHIDQFLDAHPALAPMFAVTCGLQDTTRLKPHPAPVRKAAAQLGLAPHQCVMVGDTTMDVLSGRRAGALTVGVLCGFGERRELERAGADWVLESTADLAELITGQS